MKIVNTDGSVLFEAEGSVEEIRAKLIEWALTHIIGDPRAEEIDVMDLVEALKIARSRFAEHPMWKRLDGTPWENDAPCIAAELMVNATEDRRSDADKNTNLPRASAAPEGAGTRRRAREVQPLHGRSRRNG